jgi:hypothetical protein
MVFRFSSVLLNLTCMYFIDNVCVCVYQENWSILFLFLLCLHLVMVIGPDRLHRMNFVVFLTFQFNRTV